MKTYFERILGSIAFLLILIVIGTVLVFLNLFSFDVSFSPQLIIQEVYNLLDDPKKNQYHQNIANQYNNRINSFSIHCPSFKQAINSVILFQNQKLTVDKLV